MFKIAIIFSLSQMPFKSIEHYLAVYSQTWQYERIKCTTCVTLKQLSSITFLMMRKQDAEYEKNDV